MQLAVGMQISYRLFPYPQNVNAYSYSYVQSLRRYEIATAYSSLLDCFLYKRSANVST